MLLLLAMATLQELLHNDEEERLRREDRRGGDDPYARYGLPSHAAPHAFRERPPRPSLRQRRR